VRYGSLIEPFRAAMNDIGEEPKAIDDWFHRWILFGLFPYPKRMRRLLVPTRLARRFGMLWIAHKLGLMPNRLWQLSRMLPRGKKGRGRHLPDVLPAEGKRRARVALFTGCIGDAVFRSTNWATARVLQQNGCDVLVPRGQTCCGAIHYHAGASEPARDFADSNLAAFEPDDVDAIVVNVAGCGAMLKEYGHFWQDDRQADRQRFAGKIKDVHEFLADLGPIPPQGEIKLKATYHDACHLAHAQGIREAPRRLLSLIPGLQLCELAESELCCGAAGTYNLTQPEMSQRLSRRKLENILKTGAEAVIAANAGCLLQIVAEARAQRQRLAIFHPMDLLDMSYRGKKPRR